ncbi:uncharacterized protein LOC122386540 [Amphibalanus amphitrite]|uniref:uncharacterized protein LOC122386540 n=1 Tax=Amphibalanus amphitrite TaxID=1232801 RepID=UPI001C914472|nr:uncharacterized protein LOC122386540 [Amphibalanus amphitrite]
MSVKRAMRLFRHRLPATADVIEYHRELRLRLVATLSECTKAVQHEFHDSDEPIPSGELTNELCRALEALFIHGLRDSFLERVTSAISDTRPPEPNFWPPLLVVSHSDVIEQIGALSQIRTDIGKARSWLRGALNDGLLTSYMAMIIADTRLLGYHYDRLSLMRDQEQMEIVMRYLQGLETLRFALATNSSLLNTWDEMSLEMAGIWFQPRRLGRGAVAQAQDVAAAIPEQKPRPQPPAELTLPLPEPRAPTLIMNALDPDMAFDVIMRSSCVERPSAMVNETTSGGGGAGTNSEASSLAGEVAAITGRPPPPSESYISVLESYRESSPRARSLMQTPDVQFMYGRSVDSSGASAASSAGAANDLEGSGESEKPPAENAAPDSAEQSEEKPAADEQPVPETVDSRYYWLTDIPAEGALDKQQYTCGSCHRFVGMLYGEPRLCTLDGALYCGDCHTGRDHAQLPARIIHNWDFDRYPVARCNREFLEQVDSEPTINVAEHNISIYNVSAEMDRVRLLRVRLVFLNAFLHTCRSGAAADLERRLQGRRHLCEHVHLYAPVDLRDTRNGSLASTLQTVVEFAVEHVMNCSLCSQRGFVCEFCRDENIIYPFELETTRQCRQCCGLYHSRCWRRPTPCPRCERYRRRAELRQLLGEPQLDAGQSTPAAETPAAGAQSEQ